MSTSLFSKLVVEKDLLKNAQFDCTHSSCKTITKENKMGATLGEINQRKEKDVV